MNLDGFNFLKTNSPIVIAPYYDGEHSSFIMTDEKDVYSKLSVDEVISKYCLMFGSSLEGRKEASRRQLGFIKNPPILVSEIYKIVALQVPSEQYKGESLWLFDLNFHIKELNSHKCIIYLKRQMSFIIPLSKEAIKRRKMRAIELLYNFVIHN